MLSNGWDEKFENLTYVVLMREMHLHYFVVSFSICFAFLKKKYMHM